MTIEGLQKAQQRHIKRMSAVKPEGTLGEAIYSILVPAFRYLVQITHVDTGSLKASQRMRYKNRGHLSQGELYIDKRTRNPRSGRRPSEYGVYEERRGGSHASYKRTLDFIENSGLLRQAINRVRSEI